jgi:hypothetical protein
MEWDRFQAFVKQLLIDVSRVERESALQMRSFAAGDQGVVLVEDYAPQEAFLDVRAQVSGPHDFSRTIDLKPVGPRRYEGRFPLTGEGRYQILAAAAAGERSDRVSGGFIVPYSPEYTRFRSDPIALDEVWEKTGGRRLDGTETGQQIFGLERHPKESSRPVFDWFLVALACLVPIDVGVRRVQIDLALIRSWLRFRRKAETTQTLGALLQRKEKVGEVLRSRREARPATGGPPVTPVRWPPGGIKPTVPAVAPPAGPKPPETPPGTGSTTEQLLAMKRKRGGGGK